MKQNSNTGERHREATLDVQAQPTAHWELCMSILDELRSRLPYDKTGNQIYGDVKAVMRTLANTIDAQRRQVTDATEAQRAALLGELQAHNQLTALRQRLVKLRNEQAASAL